MLTEKEIRSQMVDGKLVIPNMNDDDYHGSDGYSSTQLKDILISPAFFHAKYIANTIKREHKACFDFGHFVHAAVLEPHLVQEKFAKSQKFDRRTKQGKADFAAFELENSGKTVINEDDWERGMAMAEAVLNDPAAGNLFKSDGVNEQSWFVVDEKTGLLVKCRPDREVIGIGIPDLKTITPKGDWKAKDLQHKLRQEVRSRGYHFSAAMYLDITGHDEFVDVFVNTQPGNHWVAPYILGRNELALGRLDYRAALDTLKQCLDSGEWPGPIDKPITGTTTEYERQRLEAAGITIEQEGE